LVVFLFWGGEGSRLSAAIEKPEKRKFTCFGYFWAFSTIYFALYLNQGIIVSASTELFPLCGNSSIEFAAHAA
jgi:hypothetical protein